MKCKTVTCVTIELGYLVSDNIYAYRSCKFSDKQALRAQAFVRIDCGDIRLYGEGTIQV
jgi:hypothetical protein